MCFSLSLGTLAKDGSKFDSSVDRGKPFKFTIGKGQVIRGWDEGFASMKVGEKALLVIRHDYGYGESGSPPKIPGKADLHFEVELLGFEEKLREKWDMTVDELESTAQRLKQKGTELFQKKDYEGAIAQYSKAADYASGADEDDGAAVPEQTRALFVSSWSNVAMCHVKLQEWGPAIRACDKVLGQEPQNLKALYRRGLARLSTGFLKEAKTDLMAAYALDNSNKDVRKALATLKKESQKAKQKEKAAFGGLFAKAGGLYDDKKGIPQPSEDNPQVYFDVQHGEEKLGRYVLCV